MYIVGYSVDNPQLCTENGRTVINPTLLSKWRKLHESNRIKKFNFIHAGLNYLVAGYCGDSGTPSKLLVWGRSPNYDTSRNYKQEVSYNSRYFLCCNKKKTYKYGCLIISMEEYRIPVIWFPWVQCHVNTYTWIVNTVQCTLPRYTKENNGYL